MPDVVVIPDAEPDGDAGVAFAAGIATAEAAQASEEAAEAVVEAESAAAIAAIALEDASAARAESWAHADSVDQLRGEISELRGVVEDLAMTTTAAVAESSMTPERIEREAGPDAEHQEEKDDGGSAKKSEATGGGERKKYGNAGWFGGK